MKTFFIARDKVPFMSDSVCFSKDRPVEKVYKPSQSDSEYRYFNETMEYEEFLKIAGLKLKPGQVKKVCLKEVR